MKESDGESGLLTALVEQAQSQGANTATLRALVEEASEQGARRALRQAGLADDDAEGDVRELRNLLEAWRTARATAWRTVVRWITTILILAAAASLSLKQWPPPSS